MKKLLCTTIALTVLNLLLTSCTSYEAETMARQKVEAAVLKCGDSSYWGYLMWNGIQLYESKGLDIKTISENLTEADRANGVEWKGQIQTTWKMTRERSGFASGWTNWSQWTDSPTRSDRVMKQRGQWSFESPYKISDLRATCTNLPP